MADGVTLPGGQKILTDDCGTPGHAQGMKLAVSADGDATLIPATAADGLLVDVSRIVPGTGATHLGKQEDAAHASSDVGVMMLGVREYAGPAADGNYGPLSLTPDGLLRTRNHPNLTRLTATSSGLTTATTAYSVGDQVGTQFSFNNAARVSGGGGYIRAAVLTDAADIIGSYDLLIHRASITLAADNAAYAISDTDALEILGLIPLAGAFDIGSNRIAQALGLQVPYVCSGTTLFASLITRSAHTFFPAVTSLQLALIVEPT